VPSLKLRVLFFNLILPDTCLQHLVVYEETVINSDRSEFQSSQNTYHLFPLLEDIVETRHILDLQQSDWMKLKKNLEQN